MRSLSHCHQARRLRRPSAQAGWPVPSSVRHWCSLRKRRPDRSRRQARRRPAGAAPMRRKEGVAGSGCGSKQFPFSDCEISWLGRAPPKTGMDPSERSTDTTGGIRKSPMNGDNLRHLWGISCEIRPMFPGMQIRSGVDHGACPCIGDARGQAAWRGRAFVLSVVAGQPARLQREPAPASAAARASRSSAACVIVPSANAAAAVW